MTAPSPRRGQPVPPDAKASDYARFLKGAHLEGRSIVVTIAAFTKKKTHPNPGEEVEALVMHFAEPLPPLVLSPTNRDALTAMFGNRLSGWLNQRIELYPLTVKVGKAHKTPIRVRALKVPERLDRETGEIVQKSATTVDVQRTADPLVTAVVQAAQAAGVGTTETPALTGDPVVDFFTQAPHDAGVHRAVPAVERTAEESRTVIHPGHREYKTYCDARNVPQARRNELLRKHGGSYEDAIAELESEPKAATAAIGK